MFFPLTLQLLNTTRFSGLEHSDVFSGLHEIRHKSLARVLKQLRVFLLTLARLMLERRLGLAESGDRERTCSLTTSVCPCCLPLTQHRHMLAPKGSGPCGAAIEAAPPGLSSRSSLLLRRHVSVGEWW